VKEKPILFSGEMVRAILAKQKTQTRRVMKPQPTHVRDVNFAEFGESLKEIKCPYGNIGDRLWVREGLVKNSLEGWVYKVDESPVLVGKKDLTAMIGWAHHKDKYHCASIHMPRWASRITLEITNLRVERVQDISQDDAIDEGCTWGEKVRLPGAWEKVWTKSPVSDFHTLWDSINGKKYPWDSNPWVWVVTFKQVNDAAKD
jgi:hypothetical protein